MSKNALVIKGANFASNKLTTVTLIEDEVPCTGLSLDQTTKTVTNVTPFTLVATATPADTTDEVIWSSSDNTIATVSNGTVTVVGVGTVTITATCGNYSAACVIDATEIEPTQDYSMSTLDELASVAVRTSANLQRISIFNRSLYGEILGFRTGDGIEAAPIPLLNNVAKVKVTATSMYADTAYCFFMDTNTIASETYNNCAKLILTDNTKSTTTGTVALVYDVPSGANAVGARLRTKVADAPSENTPAIANAFAAAHGIKMTFLAE